MANKNFGNIVKNNLTTLDKVESLVSSPKYTMSRETYEQLLLSALQINEIQDYFNQYLLPTTGSTTENEFIINKYFEEVITGVNADIAKKVNTTDIVDSLTSTDTDKPLSANQGKILNDTCAKKSGVYPNLIAGKLSSFMVKGRSTTSIGWHKAMEIKAVNIGNIGGAGYSALILVNGVRGSTGESVTPAGSSIIEIDCRADNATNGVFLAGFLRINILNGWLNKKNICAVLSEDNKTISVYINIEKQFMQYNLTKLSEGAEAVENVNALTFVDEYYGSSAPGNAMYATVLNNASKADELTFVSVGTTATGNHNWYEIATVPVNASAYDAFSIILLLNGRTVGNQMSGIVELEGRCEPNNWTYKNFKVLCGNLASNHIAYYEDSDKTLHFYLYAPSAIYAISTISAQRGSRLTITFPLTELQPEQLPEGRVIGANYNFAAYDSQSNYIPNTYAKKIEIPNPNIIINPDFLINQRGQISYSATTDTGHIYTVDRVRLHNYATPTLTPKTGGGISVSGTATGSNSFILSYWVEEFAKYAGKTLTLSIKFKNVTGTGVRVRTSSTGTGDYSASITTDTLYTKTFIVNSNATELSIILATGVAGAFVFDVDWWKLEEGSVATAFTKPLTAEELPKCQRYYQKFMTKSDYREYAIGFIASTTIAHFSIPLLCEMRTTPTLSISNKAHFTVRYGAKAGTLLQTTISKMEFRSYSKNSYFVTITLANTLPIEYGVASLRSADVNSYISLNAEIY